MLGQAEQLAPSGLEGGERAQRRCHPDGRLGSGVVVGLVHRGVPGARFHNLPERGVRFGHASAFWLRQLPVLDAVVRSCNCLLARHVDPSEPLYLS